MRTVVSQIRNVSRGEGTNTPSRSSIGVEGDIAHFKSRVPEVRETVREQASDARRESILHLRRLRPLRRRTSRTRRIQNTRSPDGTGFRSAGTAVRRLAALSVMVRAED